jgi:hypothetical protein
MAEMTVSAATEPPAPTAATIRVATVRARRELDDARARVSSLASELAAAEADAVAARADAALGIEGRDPAAVGFHVEDVRRRLDVATVEQQVGERLVTDLEARLEQAEAAERAAEGAALVERWCDAQARFLELTIRQAAAGRELLGIWERDGLLAQQEAARSGAAGGVLAARSRFGRIRPAMEIVPPTDHELDRRVREARLLRQVAPGDPVIPSEA